MEDLTVPAQFGPTWRCVCTVIRAEILENPQGVTFARLADALVESSESPSPALTNTTDTERETMRYAGETMRACIATRGKRAGRLRSTPPDRRENPAAYYFHRAFFWHGGSSGGSLWGPMSDRLLGGEEWERADTLAVVVRTAIGAPMVSADRWRDALGVQP